MLNFILPVLKNQLTRMIGSKVIDGINHKIEKDKIITGENIQPGHVALGLPSNGLHTNGYSFARKLFLR